MRAFHIKLTNAFANNKNDALQIKKLGNTKNNDKINEIPEIKSMKLKTSPVNKNMLFRSNKPAQKRANCIGTEYPNMSMRNAIADAKSIKPRIFTKTIE